MYIKRFLMGPHLCTDTFCPRGKHTKLVSYLGKCRCRQVNHGLTSITYTLALTSEKAIAPHSSTFAWKIPWMEEPGRLQFMGSLRVRHEWATSLSLFHFHALEREMATHSSVLAWRIPGAGEPGGLTSMRSHRVGHDWSDLAAAAVAKWGLLRALRTSLPMQVT